MPLVLRSAEMSDLPDIVKLMNVAFRGVGPQAGWNNEIRYIDGDRTSEALLKEELAAQPDSFLLIVREPAEQAILGCVWLQPASSATWYLGSLAIDPLLQNSGLGRELLHSAEQWAQDRGAQTIRMKVLNIRDMLISWYERRGYHLTGESSPFPYGDTRFGTPRRDDLAFVILEKPLAAEGV